MKRKSMLKVVVSRGTPCLFTKPGSFLGQQPLAWEEPPGWPLRRSARNLAKKFRELAADLDKFAHENRKS